MQDEYNLERGQAMERPFRGANGNQWCGEYPVCDKDGYFIENDGSRSRVIHQYDRYGTPLYEWMVKNPYFKDVAPFMQDAEVARK